MRNIFAIILLAGAIAIFIFYTKPSYDSLQLTLGDRFSSTTKRSSKATQLQTLKQTLLSRYNSFDPNAIARLTTMLPDQVDNIRLILDLDNLAGRYGMALQNVNISSPDTASSGSVVTSIASASEPWDTLTIQFTTHGTYEQFTQFLAALQSSLRLVDLQTLTISGGTDSGTTGSTRKIRNTPM